MHREKTIIFDKKKSDIFLSCKILQFLVIKIWIRMRIDLKCWIRIRNENRCESATLNKISTLVV
jgi:hypothetical protein